jgi:hypothetical protein
VVAPPLTPSPELEVFIDRCCALEQWITDRSVSGIQLLVGFGIGEQFRAEPQLSQRLTTPILSPPKLVAYRRTVSQIGGAIHSRLQAVPTRDRLEGIAKLHNAMFAPHTTANLLCARTAQQVELGEWTTTQLQFVAPLEGIDQLTTLGPSDASTAAGAVLTWEGSAELLALVLSLPSVPSCP